MKEKGTNTFFSGLLYNNVCCQPQDGFLMFLARIEQGAIHISLLSPATEDPWNLLDLISLLIFPCLSISITLCTLRIWVSLRQYHNKKSRWWIGSSLALIILSQVHSISWNHHIQKVLRSKKSIKHSNQNKVRKESSLSPLPLFPWLFYHLL